VTAGWGGLLCSCKLALPTSCVDGLTFLFPPNQAEGERDIVAYIKTVKRLLIEDIFKA
jgi:hypothetical protein